MSIAAAKKIFKEQGAGGFLMHYGARTLTKAEKLTIGRFIAKFGKTRKNLLVFKNRENLDFTDNPRALFDYLIEMGYNEKYQIVWLVSNPKKFRKLKYKNVKFVTAENRYGWNSCRAYYYAAAAGYFFTSHSVQDLLDYGCAGRKVINLWHGCGYKGSEQGLEKNAKPPFFYYGIVPGELFAETKSKSWNCSKEQIVSIGYPRYDWLLHPSLGKEEMLGKLFGKTGIKKAVIWMPTFRKSNLAGCLEGEIQLPYDLPAIENEDEMKILDAFLKEKEMLLIIKKHPLQTGWKQKEEWQNICYVSEELLECSDLQLAELMGVCDGLISDYSSAAVDFMLLDRPMAYVLTDFGAYNEKRGFVFEDPLLYMPGEKVYNFRQLLEYLEHVSQNEDLWKEERNRLMAVMHNKTDNYCRRIVQWLKL